MYYYLLGIIIIIIICILPVVRLKKIETPTTPMQMTLLM